MSTDWVSPDADQWTKDWFAAMGAPDATDESKLHPDLQPYVETASYGGRILRHPLIYVVPGPVFWWEVNQRYEAKRKLLDRYETAGDYRGALVVYERPYRLPMLDEYRDMLSHEDFRELLADLWRDTEHPFQFGRLPYDLFAAATEVGGPLTDSEHELDALPERIRVYRGQGLAEPPGLAWTTDRAKAIWFATRLRSDDSPPPQLISGWCHKRDIYAYLTGRGESEVVIDPARVRAKRAVLLPTKRDSKRTPLCYMLGCRNVALDGRLGCADHPHAEDDE